MKSWILLSAALMPATFTVAAPVARTNTTAPTSFADVPTSYMTGFKNPSVQSSVGGQAICISGTVNVTASADNLHINMEQPANQSVVTELIVEALQINSTVGERLVGNQNKVGGTYEIYSQLCFPRSTSTINATTIQFLIHGVGFDRSYWNIAPGYSYVDIAAEQGYTTFSYDRLGTGLSDHPDPIQTVQPQLQIAIAHELIHLLRTGALSSHPFTHIVGIGHSMGSIQLSGLTAQYPSDVDAAVLTGFTAAPSGLTLGFASLDLTIASLNQPLRFPDLPSGYLTAAAIEGTQFFFFRAPAFEPALLNLAEAGKQTMSLGEFLAPGPFVPSMEFTGPIDVVVGENDVPGCQGDCLVPENKAAAVRGALYPKASEGSDWYVAPQTGHGLNFHTTAPAAYEHILGFIKRNGF